MNHGDPSLVVYNHLGDPLYKIGAKGRGPGELFGSIAFAVDTLSKEVLVWGKMANKMCVYDLEGNFKRENIFDNTITFMSFNSINEDLLMGFCENAQAYTPDFITKNNKNAPKETNFGRTLHFFRKADLSYDTDSKDIHFERIHSKNPFTGSNSLTCTKDGFYIGHNETYRVRYSRV